MTERRDYFVSALVIAAALLFVVAYRYGGEVVDVEVRASECRQGTTITIDAIGGGDYAGGGLEAECECEGCFCSCVPDESDGRLGASVMTHGRFAGVWSRDCKCECLGCACDGGYR